MFINSRITEKIAFAALLYLPCVHASADALADANMLARQLIQQTMTTEGIPGLQIAVIKNDQVVLSENYGMANVENRIPVTSTTLFPINSATKSFTGVAMMQLVEAGLMDLNAPIARYLPDLPAPWTAIRVRQLLGHTSGLPDIVDQKGFIGGATEENAWKAVKLLPMEAAVGEKFAYNQTNYGLLAKIISVQANTPYHQYVAKHQFAPANMALSTFGDSYDLIANAATIYSFNPRDPVPTGVGRRLSRWVYEMPYSLWAGGGIQTTANELARWIIKLSKGELISTSNVKYMWTAEKLNNGDDAAWGGGWPILHTAPQRQVAGIGGARAAFIVYPDDHLAIIVLTNLAGANPQRFIPQIAKLYKAR